LAAGNQAVLHASEGVAELVEAAAYGTDFIGTEHPADFLHARIGHGAKDNDRAFWNRLFDALQHFKTAAVRQANIHQDDVGSEPKE
jgi:hypothetical protein